MGNTVEATDCCTYLGSAIDSSGRSGHDVYCRIGLASSNVGIDSPTSVGNPSSVFPLNQGCVTYMFETWMSADLRLSTWPERDQYLVLRSLVMSIRPSVCPVRTHVQNGCSQKRQLWWKYSTASV